MAVKENSENKMSSRKEKKKLIYCKTAKSQFLFCRQAVVAGKKRQK